MIIPPLSGPGRTQLQSPGDEMMPMLEAMEVPNHAKQLLLQLNRQRTKGFLCDVIIVVQNALFRAHKNILAASSVYLKSLVVHDNLVNLDPEMVSPGTFRTILDYIYTGRLSEYEPSSEQSLGAVLAAASYLQLPDLVALCKKRLKRNGSYVHIRTGFSSYGKLARGLRAATPVIQSCYSATPRLLDSQPLHTLNTNSGELYAPPSQGNRLQGLALPDQATSQLLGLDLSKRSPQDDAHSGDSRQTSPPAGGPLLANGAPGKEQAVGAVHPMETDEVLGPEGGLFRGEGKGADEVSRWFKQEPLPPFADECEREKAARGERQERKGEAAGGPGPPPPPPARYPGLGCDEAEDEKSSSEDTSSDEPCGSGAAERFQCAHLGYEPEHFGDNLYVCIPCGKGFPSSEQLNAHVESHTEDDLFHKEVAEPAAPFADKPGAALGDLVRPYRCSSCDKSYKDPATLRQHEKSHWLTRPYPCNICGKKFTQRGTMTRHMRSHLGLKPFACEACGMRFTRQYRLTEHMRIHSGEKPYECQICGGKFAQQRNLISHMKMHTADCKPKLDFGDSVYPLAKFAATHLAIHQDKAAEILSQSAQLAPDSFPAP